MISPIVDPRLKGVHDLLQAQVESGVERGASLCVVHDGEVLLDTWAGWTDEDRVLPWTHDTIAPVWSVSKLVVNLAALVLHDRGDLDVDAPVADYWPEFAQAGKTEVTVAMLLAHSSGVPAWAAPITVDEIFDWDRSTSLLAAQEPWWEPGTAPGYHLLNQGHLVGEVVRRVSGRTVGEFVAQEIAGPLGADFHLGLAPEHDHRVSAVSPPRAIDVDLDGVGGDSIMLRSLTGPFLHAREANTERWRRGAVPAANGHGNARSIARIQSVVSHGGLVDGIRLLSEETVDRILEPQAAGVDHVLGLPIRFGLGWALPEPRVMPSVAPGRRCYWGGLGGSVVVNDLDQRLTIAYVMNRMIFETVPGYPVRRVRPCGDSRSDAYLAEIVEALS